MPAYRTGRVVEITSSRRGLQRVTVAFDHDEGGPEPAYVLTELVGPVAAGDEVVVNTTAADLGLGTGGWHVAHWNLSRREWRSGGGGHVMKLRYTSLQADTGVTEEHPGYEAPADLGRRPVVACLLHSQVACVAAAFAVAAPGRRLVYVMTDGAALPLALSDLVAGLVGTSLLAATVTAGQAFGGDHEAVNLPSALDVAVAAAGADALVVGPGPGVVGTGTARGFSALEVASVLDAAAWRGGRPLVAVRCSEADSRDRHRGVSHHVGTALASTAAKAIVPVPEGEEQLLPEAVAAHDVRTVAGVPDVDGLLRAAGVVVTTMGRTAADDPAFFRWSAAAGTLAARLAVTSSP